jgi:CDP-glycerol glycerophosphotransferase
VGVRIVYNSFHGRYSDNPRALYQALRDRPGLEHVWLTDSRHRAGFPDDATTVDIDGPDARDALESADLVIASSHTEVDWEKGPGTTYLQTWHGTPLKRVHRDVLWAPEGRLDELDVDIEKWDLLLSPNAVSTPRLRKAFGYDGEVLESGYPRNDLLSLPAQEQVRADVRRRFGIADGVTAVLYAPTWRNDEVLLDPDAELPLALDPVAFAAEMGRDHALLFRSHYLATGRSRVAAAPGVHDVSFHPDINELYAAADVMVTDYSSTMFDFAITGRPIVFYPYDRDRYGDVVRGFYFELGPDDAPGPVVTTEPELLETLSRLPDTRQAYAERYRAFQRTFTSLEDGHATDRVLERLGL